MYIINLSFEYTKMVKVKKTCHQTVPSKSVTEIYIDSNGPDQSTHIHGLIRAFALHLQNH